MPVALTEATARKLLQLELAAARPDGRRICEALFDAFLLLMAAGYSRRRANLIAKTIVLTRFQCGDCPPELIDVAVAHARGIIATEAGAKSYSWFLLVDEYGSTSTMLPFYKHLVERWLPAQPVVQ
jgi:hypothetical protein